MMALLKVAREQNQGKLDNLVDAIGYMAIASEVGESPAPAKKGIFSK